MSPDQEKKDIPGGSFLVDQHGMDSVFTPEDFTDEHLMMAEAAEQFVDGEIMPQVPELEKHNDELTVSLLKKAGQLELLSVEVPEEYGGMELPKATACLVSEQFAKTGGFIVSHGATTGIGTQPIVYFGNKDQKERYLRKLASGELLSAYALTEESSGSDALNAKTKAVLSEDGKHYILNGSKVWITNAGFADLFIVFAKIDGKDFSAFIVEKAFDGVSVGPSEKKMGIRSSSTSTVFLEDAKVPVENLLGERGKGHKIAFNILNIGRFKLGAGCVGGSKQILEISTAYAKERRAFGKTISEFGMIQEKLSEMAIKTFASESMLYRTAGYIDHIIEGVTFGEEGAEARILKGIEEYAIECAMVKVFTTESLDFVADEGVQIHGGYGYSQEYEVERAYRDSRINRIFEGTNEINRMLIVDMLIKRAMRGSIPLMEKAKSLMTEIMGPPSFGLTQDFSLLADEKNIVENAKKIFMFVAGAAFQKFLDALGDQQELLGMAADVLIETYVAESALIRTLKHVEKSGEEDAALMIAATKVICHDAMERIQTLTRTALAGIEDGDTLKTMMAALKRLSKHSPVNTIALRRQIAAALIEKGGYPY